MIYPRELTGKLLSETRSTRAVVLTGMRQTGKTTLMRQVFDSIKSENKVFLDLENPLNQKAFEETDFENILLNLKEFGISPGKKCYVFLDEIQLAPGISQAVKYLVDHHKVKFFLTGSSSYYLKNLFPESLAGRKVVYELFPLSFAEFLVFKERGKKLEADFSGKAKQKNKVSFEKEKKLFDEYLTYGGFPGVVVEKKNKKTLLEDIFTSYFEKDVKTLADFREMKSLRDLILLLANRAGSKLEVSKISREIGISRVTVYSYLDFLEKTYFISLLPPFSRNIDGEVRGTRKVYLCDTGMLQYLGKTTEGTIFENAVYLNIRQRGKIRYYEKYRGPEIDFIVDGKVALEAKLHGDETDLKRLKRTARNLNITKYYLVTRDFMDHPRSIPAVDM